MRRGEKFLGTRTRAERLLVEEGRSAGDGLGGGKKSGFQVSRQAHIGTH